MRNIITILLVLFCQTVFCQDTAVVTISNLKNVTGFSVQYSRDNIVWSDAIVLPIPDTGTYKFPFAAFTGFYRVKAIGVNQYSVTVKVLNALPVTVSNFWRVSDGQNDILMWHVEGESNIKKYLISRSLDGVHFEYVGEVPANGKSDYQIKIAR